MGKYQNIILATDLSEEADQVAAKAHSIATADNATLHFIHVIEPLSFAYGGDILMDFSTVQDEIQAQAETQMSTFAAKYGVDESHQHIILNPDPEVTLEVDSRLDRDDQLDNAPIMFIKQCSQ